MSSSKRKRDEDLGEGEEYDEDDSKQESVLIRRPSMSSKSYKSIVLPNGLAVCLVSDKSIRKGYAAMAVRVGSFDDPLDFQGMAHFIEHMLFTGSTKYRGNNEIDSFLAQHGGDSDAVTESEHTMYHMSVDVKHLKNALDRFAHLFIDPRFDPKAANGEVQAVNSEFELVRNDDECRLDQLRGHTSKPGHVFRKFSWGNKKSLTNDFDALCEQSLALFTKGYIGASMKLVVVGAESFEVLESWVSNSFECVQKGNERCPGLRQQTPIRQPTPIWTSDKVFVLKAVENIHRFDISWMIPPQDPVSILLVQVLGHECNGSLLSFFKDKGWASSIRVTAGDSGEDDNSFYCSTSVGDMFTISLHLTSAGLDEKYEMVSYIYQYLELARATPFAQVMSEYSILKKCQFDCLDIDADLSLLTQRFAANMLHHPVENAISCDYEVPTITRRDIDNLLAYFKPDNMRLDLVTSSLKTYDFENTEPWFGSQYTEESIPICYKNKWTDIVKVDGNLSLPPENIYTPTSYIIGSSETESGGSETESGGSETELGGSETVLGGSEAESGGSKAESGGSESVPEKIADVPCMTLAHTRSRLPICKIFGLLECGR